MSLGFWLHDLSFYSAFAVLFPQALIVRRNAPRFAVAAGDPFGTVGDGPLIHVLGIGDSIIAGVGPEHQEHAMLAQSAAAFAVVSGRTVHWRAAGTNGATSDDVLRVLPALIGTEADCILISVGVNDLTALSHSWRWAGRLRRLLEFIEAHWPKAQIVLAGLPPMDEFPLLPQPMRALLGWRARHFDAIARDIAAHHPRVRHLAVRIDPGVDVFAADGFHPSGIGCRLMAAPIAQSWFQQTAST